MRHKNDNMNRFRKTKCAKCGQEVSDRKSVAVEPSNLQDENAVVLVKSESGSIVTRKALPRVHKGGCPTE